MAAGDPMASCFIIAEAGVNHNGTPELAHRMVDVAAECGANAVKFQTFAAERLATPTAPKARYQLETTEESESQLEMLSSLELHESAYQELCAHADQIGIEFMSAPFDEASADLLERIGVRRFKIPSGELVNHPLLRHIGAKGKPVILSTGMSYIGEVESAVHVLQDVGCADITLLHCTSCYPADPADCNLRAIATLRMALGLPVGYSDHTAGIEVAVAAVALGAQAIEKHFTLDKTLPGPDQRASLEPPELTALVAVIRRIEVAMGDGIKRPMPSELDTRAVARRSLVASRDLEAGTVLRAKDLCAKRPGTGIPPFDIEAVIGRRLQVPLQTDQVLEWTHLA